MNPVTDTVCRFEIENGAGSVFLNASTIGELKAKAIEAFLSLPRRGVEIGGLLFGKEQEGDPFIQRFEEASCEHRYGPSFTLSEGDHVELTGKLARARREEFLPVIGFYRSYTGRRAVIEAVDRALIREHFPKGDAVFLLLQPVDAQTCTTTFRLCRDGEFRDDPDHKPVAFDPEVREASAPSVNGEAVPEPVREVPVPGEPAAPVTLRSLPPRPVPLETVEARSRPTRWWLPVLMCLIGIIGGTALYRILGPAQQPRWVDVYLSAKPSADAHSLNLTWDTAAPRVAGATHAILAVTDGTAHHDVPLSLEQLQLGSYAYTPNTSDLEFRLVLYGKGPALSSGALRVTPAFLPAAAPAPPPQIPAPPAPPVESADRTAPAKPAGSRATVREVQPSVPEGIRARLDREVRIPVTVTINARGQVTGATTPASESGLRRYLAQQSLRAARQWRFATAGPSADPAEKTIYFTFSR